MGHGARKPVNLVDTQHITGLQNVSYQALEDRTHLNSRLFLLNNTHHPVTLKSRHLELC
jgi:hypothetical protein